MRGNVGHTLSNLRWHYEVCPRRFACGWACQRHDFFSQFVNRSLLIRPTCGRDLEGFFHVTMCDVQLSWLTSVALKLQVVCVDLLVQAFALRFGTFQKFIVLVHFRIVSIDSVVAGVIEGSVFPL